MISVKLELTEMNLLWSGDIPQVEAHRKEVHRDGSRSSGDIPQVKAHREESLANNNILQVGAPRKEVLAKAAISQGQSLVKRLYPEKDLLWSSPR